MKIVLFDLENQIAPPLLEEALDLVKETNEYDLTEPEEGYYHCLSKQPDYHVELTLKADGTATGKCHCTVFKRANQCKHTIAAMLILREHLLRSRRGPRYVFSNDIKFYGRRSKVGRALFGKCRSALCDRHHSSRWPQNLLAVN